MPNTSVHFPEGLLDELDRLAEERGVSRNRLIVDSCRELIRVRRQWPDGFFSNDYLSAEDLAELERSGDEFTATIEAGRRSRRGSPL